jgi:hypothetical protein
VLAQFGGFFMAHHGSQDFSDMAKYQDMINKQYKNGENLFKAFAERVGLGATENFPDGKIDPSDEGEIRFAMTISDGKLIMNFGKPTVWVGLTKENVNDLVAYLQEKVKEM